MTTIVTVNFPHVIFPLLTKESNQGVGGLLRNHSTLMLCTGNVQLLYNATVIFVSETHRLMHAAFFKHF